MTGKACARKGGHTRASGTNLPMNHQMIGDVMKNGSEASIHWRITFAERRIQLENSHYSLHRINC
jgi:hypothetical protein